MSEMRFSNDLTIMDASGGTRGTEVPAGDFMGVLLNSIQKNMKLLADLSQETSIKSREEREKIILRAELLLSDLRFFIEKLYDMNDAE